MTPPPPPRLRFSFDTETFPILPGRQAPRVVCLQSRFAGQDRIDLRDHGARDRLAAALRDPRVLIIGHHVAYDALTTSATWPELLPLWIWAYEQGRVTCTHEREKLIRIAQGTLPRYHSNGLLDLCKRYKIAHGFQEGDKEAGSWRTRYGELDGIDPALWPEDPRRYALADLVVDDVYQAQETCPPAWLRDQYRQARGAFWAALTSAWGMRVDPEAVEAFSARLERENEYVRALLETADPVALARYVATWNEDHPDADPALRADLKIQTPSGEWVEVPYAGGLVRRVGSKDTKAAAERMRRVCRLQGRPVPMTDTGKDKAKDAGIEKGSPAWIALADQYTALDADSTLATRDPVLMAYSRYGSIGILRSRVQRLKAAAAHGVPIQPRFNNLVETGRMSCSAGDMKPGRPVTAFGDQTQNPHRAPGLRECYTARPGHVIISVDWKAAELNGLAQCCIDLGLDSNMARIINSGRDLHLWYACQVQGWDYTWAADALAGKHGPAEKKRVKTARQGAKACNFGFPGGLGVEKFILYAWKTYQVLFTRPEAEARKQIWLDAFPEMRAYFAWISDLCERGDPFVQFQSLRVRGDVRYTSAANSGFQGRIADMAKDAGFRIAKATHLEGLPARQWNFAHDEFLAEAQEARAHEAAMWIKAIMEAAGRTWCPDVPVEAEPAISRIWRKGAEPFWRDGRLVPWEDRDMDPDTSGKIQKALARGDDPLYTSWVYGFDVNRIREAA